jgi:hypothetical protein
MAQRGDAVTRAEVTAAIQRLRIAFIHAPPPEGFGGLCATAGCRVGGKAIGRRTIWVDPCIPGTLWTVVVMHEAGHALAPEDGDDHTEILGRSMQRLYRKLLDYDPWALRVVLHPWWPFVVGPLTLMVAQVGIAAGLHFGRPSKALATPVTPGPTSGK